MKQQRVNDEDLVSLVEAMITTYTFTSDLRKLSDKPKSLEDVITRVFQQTTECALFVCDYFRPGFLGMWNPL